MKEKRKQALRRALRQGLGVGAGIMMASSSASLCAIYFLAAGLVAFAVSCLAAFLEERKRRRG